MTFEGGIAHGATMETDAARIMIVAQSGALYQSLARMLEERLRGCHAVICQAGAADMRADDDIRLVLIHASCPPCCDGAGIQREIGVQRSLHPAASVAILIDDPEALTPHCRDLFATQQVQGILPMTLRLEVWLAAVLLLLSGGEYYPAPHRGNAAGDHHPQQSPPAAVAAQSQADAARTDAPARQPAAVAAPAVVSPPPRVLASLTARERETLELLSEGHQNKLIAHKMSLSEHTVKVHVHNLLAKLHVSNRTQAAATYRRNQMRAADVASPVMPRDANGAGANSSC